MRLFAAVLPSPAAVAELASAVDALHALPGAGRLRWTERAGWHFTLAFYGEVAEPVRTELERRLARAAVRGQPLTLRLAGAGRFGERALWADVAGDLGPLKRLAASAGAAGRRSGVPVEDKTLRPHLTLARVRGRSTASGSAGAAASPAASSSDAGSSAVVSPAGPATAPDLRTYVAALDGFEGEPWTAGELALVRSNLPTSGVPGEQPRYETVAAWALGR